MLEIVRLCTLPRGAGDWKFDCGFDYASFALLGASLVRFNGYLRAGSMGSLKPWPRKPWKLAAFTDHEPRHPRNRVVSTLSQRMQRWLSLPCIIYLY